MQPHHFQNPRTKGTTALAKRALECALGSFKTPVKSATAALAKRALKCAAGTGNHDAKMRSRHWQNAR